MAIVSSKDISPVLRLITVSERLDLQGTEKIEQSFVSLTRTGQQNVVVDIADVPFLSSVGIRMLITSSKALKETGGRMALVVGHNVAAIKTLKMTCVDSILPMFEKFAEAEAALKS
jgi:anti-anti-sigma factor